MNVRRFLLVLPLAASLVAAAASPAAASCAAPPGGAFDIDKEPFVFVGTVDSADSTGRVANVMVESVWKGDVAEHVQVKGGSGDPRMISSVDRGFEVGTRYLFVPTGGNGQVFEDNACSDTQQWTRKVERQRPDGAVAVSGPPPPVDPVAQEAADDAGAPADATPAPSNDMGWIAVTAAMAVVAVLAIGWMARHRGRTDPAP